MYRFVNNAPLNWTDPMGLAKISIWASAFIKPKEITFPYVGAECVNQIVFHGLIHLQNGMVMVEDLVLINHQEVIIR